MKHWIVRIVRFLFGLVGYNISIYTGGGSLEMYWSRKVRKVKNEQRPAMTVDEFTRAVTAAKYDYKEYVSKVLTEKVFSTQAEESEHE